jgi:peptidoglycan/xylan/chitin deacetylase (PgdA/CDA1 family)
MAGLGFEIASHTLTHPNLGALPVAEARREMVDSKRLIEREVGRPVRWLACPFGGPENFHTDLLPLVAEAGYEACFSAHGGVLGPGTRGLLLPRESVAYFASVLNLELYLRGSLRWFYALKRKLRRPGTGSGTWERLWGEALLGPTAADGRPRPVS